MESALKLFFSLISWKSSALGAVVLTTAVATLVLLTGCVTSTTVATKIPDQAAKTDALYRAQIHTERASEYYRLGRIPVALEAAKEAVAALPTHAPAYNMLGIVYNELRQDDQAREAYETALRLAPNDSETLNNYGWFLCQHQNPRQAMQYFETALKNPVYASPERALYNMGFARVALAIARWRSGNCARLCAVSRATPPRCMSWRILTSLRINSKKQKPCWPDIMS